jgi:class 3 adenylate cyclase
MAAMTLPAGTVTCVFTDIEGSTALVKRLGDRYGDVLRTHRQIVRDTFGPSGGVEIDTQGDSFFFAFPRAREAVAAAVAVQRTHATTEWPEGAPVRVRIGLHTGEPTVGDEGYHGLDVVRAARICGVGRGGSVLLSETTRALMGSSVPEGVSVSAPDEQRLKGLDESELVYELRIDGVDVTPASEPPAAEPEPPPEPEAEADRKTSRRTGRRLQGFASA